MSPTPRPHAGACKDLPAPGVWQEITPPNVANSQAMVLDARTPGTIYVGAAPKSGIPGGFYKSTACGATGSWVHMNTGRNAQEVDQSSIWSMIVDPNDSRIAYVVGAYGPEGIFKTTDGGTNWTQVMPPNGTFDKAVPYNFVANISIDPTNSLHLLAVAHGDCYGVNPVCFAESKDGGTTWQMGYVDKSAYPKIGSGWGEQNGITILEGDHWIFQMVVDGLWVTLDAGKTWREATPSGVKGATGLEYVNRPFTKSSGGYYYIPSYQEQGILRSTDGKTWTHISSPAASYNVGFVAAAGRLFMGDMFGTSNYFMSSESTPNQWTALPPLPSTRLGSVYLDYDAAHNVLYSSNFEGGLWRIVVP